MFSPWWVPIWVIHPLKPCHWQCSLLVSDCSDQGLSHKLNFARSTRQWVSACVSFGSLLRWFLTESWNRSQFVVQKVLSTSTPDAWAILLSSWLKPSIKGILSLAIFPASCSSFGSFTSSQSWSAAWLSLSQISLESRSGNLTIFSQQCCGSEYHDGISDCSKFNVLDSTLERFSALAFSFKKPFNEKREDATYTQTRTFDQISW